MNGVEANSAGASSCAQGEAAVSTGSPHSTKGGEIAAVAELRLGDQPIPGSSTLGIQAGTYQLTLTGTYRGILFRFAPVDGTTDLNNILTFADTTNYKSIPTLCVTPVRGLVSLSKCWLILSNRLIFLSFYR
jgi:hypothetical protein